LPKSAGDVLSQNGLRRAFSDDGTGEVRLIQYAIFLQRRTMTTRQQVLHPFGLPYVPLEDIIYTFEHLMADEDISEPMLRVNESVARQTRPG